MLEYYDYLPDNNLETKYFNEIIEHLDIDIAVVAKNFGDTVPKVDREKIMLINADEAYRIPEEVNDPSVKLIFKQYCYKNQHPKLRPIPLCPSKEFIVTEKPILERKFDISFVGQIAVTRSGFYREVPEFLMDSSVNSFFGFYEGFNRGLDCSMYSNILCDTKIAVCPHGAGSPESFRFFEACAASCVILTVEQPENWVYHNAPYVKFKNNNFPHTYSIAKELLSNPDRLVSISDATKLYYNEQISAEAVSKYIKGELHECGSNR